MSIVILVNSLHKGSFNSFLTDKQIIQLYGAFSFMRSNQGQDFWLRYATRKRNIDGEFIHALIDVCYLIEHEWLVPRLRSLLKPDTILIDKQYEELYT